MEGQILSEIILGLLVIVSTIVSVFFLKADIKENKAELKKDIGEVKAELKKDIGEANGKIKQIQNTIVQIQNTIVQIQNKISQLIGFTQAKHNQPLIFDKIATGQSNSPITINKRGIEVAEKLKIRELVNKYSHRIIVPEDATEYEIQQICFEFSLFLRENVITRQERVEIDKHMYEDDGKPDNTLFVYGVLFRDKILEERGFPVPAYSH